jgi:hypothetical protein
LCQPVRESPTKKFGLKINATVFFSFFLSPTFTFLPEGVIVGFRNFARGLKSQKIRFGVNEIAPAPGGVNFFWKKEKCLDSLEMGRKLIQTCAPEKISWCQWEAERMV